MQLISFALLHFAAVLLLAISSYILGRRLTRAIAYFSVFEQVAFCTALGLGVVAYLLFFLGLADILYSPVLIAVLLALEIVCYREWIDLGRSLVMVAKRLGTRLGLSIATLLGALVLIAFYPAWRLPLYPPTSFDATMYHLAVAKLYVVHHSLVFDPYLRFPVFPQTNELLSASMLMLYDDITAQLVQFLMIVLVAVALCAWGHRVFSLRVGAWSAALWLSNPLVLQVGSTAVIDAGLTLFICLATYAMFNWVITRSIGWLALAAIFTGLGAGSKYSALFFLGAFGLVTLFIAMRERNWVYPLLYVGIALAIAAPWYVRSFYYTHNPVEPFLPEIFGYHLWNEADMQVQLRDWALKGMGKDLGALALLPWNLAQYQGRFGNDLPLLTVYFWLLPLTLLFAIRHRYIRGLMLLVGAYTLFWFYNAQIQRYLLPVIPMLILATVASIDLAISWLPFQRQRRAYLLVAATGLVIFAAPGWLFAAQRVASKGDVPVTQVERDVYLAQSLPSYSAHVWLDNVEATSYGLYGLYDEDMAYFTGGDFKGNTLGPARYTQIADNVNTGSALYDALARLDVDYFLVNGNRKGVTLPNDEFFQQHFSRVYADPTADVTIYKLAR